MNHRSRIGQVLFTALFVISTSLQGFQPAAAADHGGVRISRNPHTGKVSFIGATSAKPINVHAAEAPGMAVRDRALKMVEAYASDFGLKQPGRELKLKNTEKLKGRSVTKFQQAYQDIPVMGGELIVDATDEGGLISMNGEISPDLSLNTQPSITAEQARDAALKSMARAYQADAASFEATEPQLWVYDSRLLEDDGTPPSLVWRMDVTAVDQSQSVRELVLIDAQRGSLVLHFNQDDASWGSQPSAPAAAAQSEPASVPAAPDSIQPSLPQQESGTTRYVATTGTDAGDCTASVSPCLTINYAISQALADDVLKVASGVYTSSLSSVNVVNVSKSVALRGGWNASFTAQDGASIVDGGGLRRGMYINASSTMDRFVVQNGRPNNGAGVYIGEGGPALVVTITNSTITANVPDPAYAANGAGIYVASGSLTLANSTVAGNDPLGSAVASHRGGGLYVATAGSVTILNSTIANNSAAQGGGLWLASGAAVTLRNSILSNPASGTTGADCYGAISISDHDIIRSTASCTVTPGAGDLFNVDPQLGNYLIGDPGYLVLQAGNPAIDAGNPDTCLSTDQRGLSRPEGSACDLGAYEYAVPGPAASLTVISGDEQIAAPRSTLPKPLAVSLLDSDGDPVVGGTVAFVAPDSGPSGTFADTSTYQTTAVTDSRGVANAALFTVNGLLGGYDISVSFDSLPPVQFHVVNEAVFVDWARPDDSGDCLTPSAACRTIDAAMQKVASGGAVLVALGTYTGTDTSVVTISKNVLLSGGWDFSSMLQTGRSTIDGEHARRGVNVNSSAGPVTISHFIIENGQTSDVGGGIRAGTRLILESSVVRNNVSATAGGGISAGDLTVQDSLITHNMASAASGSTAGGGITSSKATILNSHISENVAQTTSSGGYDSGGGIRTLYLDLVGSTVSGNSVKAAARGSAYGGGIYSYYTLTVANSTIADNSVSIGGDTALYEDQGAGIYAGSTLTIDNSTIVSNRGGAYSAIYTYVSTGHTATLRNTIIADNVAGNLSQCAFLGQGWIIKRVLVDRKYDCWSTVPPGVIVANPRLVPSAVGDPPFYALMPDSPAIGAANLPTCLPTDQRGLSRLEDGACDIGAIEYAGTGSVPAYIVPYQGASQFAMLGSPAPQALVAVVVDAGGAPVPGVAVQFRAPANGASATLLNGTNSYTLLTGSDGIAAAGQILPNTVEGSYVIEASVTGLAEPARFYVTNILADVQVSAVTNPYMTTQLPGTLVCTLAQPGCTNGKNLDADDAQSYAYGTYLFYRDHFGRNSLDDAGMPILITVHYGSDYANAFWNGARAVFGSGWSRAEDIVAHELTHGVTQYTSGLFYYYQSGAINESLSDFFGEMYDQSNDTTMVGKWQIGEDLLDGTLRSLSSPPAYGDPDRITSAKYYKGDKDSGGVHTNSGVNNKAAYLMVEGGTFNGQTVTALGAEKTLSVYYEAETHLLTSGSDYADLYDALYQACLNLLGSPSGLVDSDCESVRAATRAVEMNKQPVASYNAEAPLCSAGLAPVDLFYDGFESRASKWSFQVQKGKQRWQLDSPYGPFAHSGDHFLYADDFPPSVTDVSVQMKNGVKLPANAFLNFAHAFDFEHYLGYAVWFDGGVLEYSTDGGASWHDSGPLTTNNGYRGSLVTGAGNPLAGRRAFVGTSHGYISTRVNLSSLAGKTVRFRWRMGLDSLGNGWGWWLDDVRIYTCGGFGKLTPSNGATGQPLPVTLSWRPVAGATSYEYCYSTTAGECAGWLTHGTSTSVAVSGLAPNTTYYWQVQAKSPGGTVEANSGWWSFTTGPLPSAFGKLAPLSSPSIAQSLSPVLTWQTAAGANGYEFCYDTLDNNACDTNWIHTAVRSAPLTGLELGTTYYWQVRGLNSLGSIEADDGAWFTLVTAPGLYLISGNVPAAAATVVFTGTTPDGPVNGRVITGAAGDYTIGVPAHWSGSITPSVPQVALDPLKADYTDVTADQLDQDYRGTRSFKSIGKDDGWIIEAGESITRGFAVNSVDGTIRLGDDSLKRQYRSILSFDTSLLPDQAIVTDLTLVLTKESITPAGTDPFSLLQGLMLDVRTGSFGDQAWLGATDFQAVANKDSVGPFRPTPVSGVYTVHLPPALGSYIRLTSAKSGRTQIRLRFKLDDNNNSMANYISFFSGNAPDKVKRPTLIITYLMP